MKYLLFLLALSTTAAPQLYKQVDGKRIPYTAAEQAAWEAKHEGPAATERARTAKLSAIDAKTDALIAAATFEHGGKQFSLTKRARERWQGVGSVGNSGGGAGQQVSASDRTRITIGNANDAKAFFGKMATKVATIESSAYVLIDAALAATTLAEVAAVTDNRE